MIVPGVNCIYCVAVGFPARSDGNAGSCQTRLSLSLRDELQLVPYTLFVD